MVNSLNVSDYSRKNNTDSEFVTRIVQILTTFLQTWTLLDFQRFFAQNRRFRQSLSYNQGLVTA